MTDERILVSVCTITYNHEKYIEQAIKGVLAQVHNYRIEFVIGDDCSTDGTRRIVQKYAALHPDVIVPLLPEKNLGAQANAIQCLMRCRGKYIASLEGDDHWTDPYKLQKQVSYLEANPDVSLCFTDVDIIDEIGLPHPDPFKRPPGRDIYTIEDIIMAEAAFIPTATIVFRNQFPQPLPQFYVHAKSGDIGIHLMMAHIGKIGYLPGKTAVYVQHSGGITKSEEHIDKYYNSLAELYEEANRYFEYRYDATFKRRLLEMARTQLIYFSRNKKGGAKLRHVWANAGRYFRHAGFRPKEVLYYTAVLFFPSLLKGRKTR